MTVLDVACGSGVWGISIALADPKAQIIAQDFPRSWKSQRATSNTTALRSSSPTYQEIAASRLRAIPSLILRFWNILHSEGERYSRELLKRIHPALKDSGRIAIIDLIPDEEQQDRNRLSLSLWPCCWIPKKAIFLRFPNISVWLGEAGYDSFETAAIGSHSPIIIARKSRTS